MMTPDNDKQIKYAIGITFFLFLVIRILGAFLIDANWSFTHLFYIPIWYYAVPVIVCLSLFYLLQNKYQLVESIVETRTKQIILFVFFFLIFFLFQFDSFLYGGGNYKINQIAQVDKIIFRFYEFGTVYLVSLFYKIFSLFNLKDTTAGVMSWKVFSYLGTAFSFITSLLLAKLINGNSKKRFLIFLIIFFGPQTLSYFGFIGNTSFIAALIYFFIYVGLRFEKNKSFKTLGILWLVTLFSVFIHISLLLLIPALLFISFKKLIKKKQIAFIIGIISYLLLTAAVFIITSSHFEYSKTILFLKGQNIQVRYNLLSLRHICDYLQLLLLFIPQIIIVKFLFFKRAKEILTSYRFQLVTLVILSSNTLLFILEPTHSMILDAPMFAVYLVPITILFVLLISNLETSLKYAAVFSLFIPLVILPSYIHIDTAEKQIEDFLEKNNQFYIESSTALQDSYFYLKKLDKANYWYINLPKISRDFLDLTAAGEFNYAKMYPEALKLYRELKLKYTFWGEPRFQIASIKINQKQFNLARPELDSCLMISPYAKPYLKLDYAYYREMGNYTKAKEKILYALSIFPHDYDIKTDLAIIYYRLKDIKNADSTAREVISKDPSQAFAYLIRGFISEINKQPAHAIEYFKKFIKLAPDEPETPDIRKRLNNLILEQEK